MKKTLLINTFLLTFIFIFNSCSNKKNNTESENSNTQKYIEKNITSGDFTVDTENSNIEWLGTKTTGSHNGNLLVQKGIINIDENGVISKGKFILDMGSINCTDLVDKPDKKQYLEDHLKNADFFDTASHPTAMFRITKVDNNTMSGVLTIKGISKEINFNYSQIAKLTYEAEIIVDRTLFDIKYKSKSIHINV